MSPAVPRSKGSELAQARTHAAGIRSSSAQISGGGFGRGAKPSSERKSYPQVDPRALGLMHRAVAPCPPSTTVKAALALIKRRRLRLLTVETGGTSGVVLPKDLRRARALGLGGRRAREVARFGTAVVTAGASEVAVRRRLIGGAVAVLVRDHRRIVGAVEPTGRELERPSISLLPRLEGELPAEMLRLLRRIGSVGDSLGLRAYAVGGIVRDLLLGREIRELDIVVEGDAVSLARRLATETGGTLLVHKAFGTATLEGGGARRIDLASARQERYRTPGALPLVTPASITEDLLRRDFSVNAMALMLAPSRFGDLLDPLGGRADLEHGRLRILHPLSFVEDPTRIFRGIRYQTRLGFQLDRESHRGLKLALALAPYPALSGQRLTAELARTLAEPEGPQSLIVLGRLGSLTLIDPDYRLSSVAAKRVAALAHWFAWLRQRGIGFEPLRLGLLALLGTSPDEVVRRGLNRLALSGEPLVRLMTACREGPALAERLAKESGAAPSVRAALMRERSLETLGAAWLAGSEGAQRQVEWFLREGRAVQPFLGGHELLALGMTRGPRIRDLLDRLRDHRLDGVATTREEEVALVRGWIGSDKSEEAREDPGTGRGD